MRNRVVGARARGVVVACLAVAGCELEEITIVESASLVVAEVYVHIAEDPDDNSVLAFLHWTVGTDTTDRAPLSDSRITLRGEDGLEIDLVPEQERVCVGALAPDEVAACFVARDQDRPLLRPGQVMEVDVSLPDGGTLFGATRVPADFGLHDLPDVCRLEPDTVLELSWSRSEGAWAYVNETSIRNLPAALEDEGIVVEEDPLYLLGLSISDQDTTIVFPSEFGVFNRFELDQDVAVRLQRGLPDETVAEVTITAVDRNYVNWARGGSFNPSGQVRIPSLRGDGTGTFGASVNRSFVLISSWTGSGSVPDCAPATTH